MSKWNKFPRFVLVFMLLISFCAGLFAPQVETVEAKPLSAVFGDVVINEVAWGGTVVNSNYEWIELHNRTNSPINFGSGWSLSDGNDVVIVLTGTIPAQGYYLIEKNVNATPLTQDQIFTGTLSNTTEMLSLQEGLTIIDTANNGCSGCWYEGSGSPDYLTMERIGFTSDTASDWISSTGTPCNSQIDLALSMNLVSISGVNATYAITVTNQGYGTATNISVTDNLLSLSPDVVFSNATATAGTYTSGTGIWSVGSLATGNSESLAITVTNNSIVLETIYAQISAVTENDPDSIKNNSSTNEDDDDSIVLGNPMLTITNVVNNPTPNIGDNVVFTINISNLSGPDATGVSVDALLPGGLSFVSSSTTVGTYNSSIGVWDFGASGLSTGSDEELTITANVLSSSQMTLVADVSATGFGNNSASATVTPDPSTQSNLSLTQTWIRSAGAADTAILNITVANQEPSTNFANNVQVRSLLPSGLTYVSHTSGQNYNSSTGIWAVGDVQGGPANSKTLSITVRVSASGTSTSNFAEIWQVDQFDPNSTPANGDIGEDDGASVEVLVADLSLTQTVDIAGSNAVFTLRVTNSGPDDATNINVDNSQLHQPSSYIYVSHATASGTYDSGTGIWDIGTLASGATVTLVVTTTIVSPNENWAEIDDVNEVDPDSLPNNNSRNEDDDAASPSADLSITKTIVDPNPYTNQNIDTNVTFRITVTNSGYANATGVEVKDLLPAGLTYVSHTSGQTYNKTSGIWAVGNLPRNTSLYLEITAKVTSLGIRTNWAEVWKSSQSDPDSDPGDSSRTSDDDASATVTSYRSVIINEIAWAGTNASTEDEWIELYNPSDAAITITDWEIRKDNCIGAVYITLTGSISKDGYFLLERGDNQTVSDISANQIYPDTVPALDDAGETLYLCDNLGNFIDTANKQGENDSTNPWPAGDDESPRESMERRNNSVENDSSWLTNNGITKNGLNASNGAIYGTPGRKNAVTSTSTSVPATATSIPIPVIPPRPIINELLPRPGFDWNQDGRVDVFDEFIEIKNLTAIDITLKGWKLDKDNGRTSFALPDVTLKPNEHIVFYSLETNLLLSDGGETIRLINSAGKIYDAYTYTIARAEDQSFCRLPDGRASDSAWFDDCIPTPAQTNTREGSVPSSPNGDNESFICDLPDTLHPDFFFAECKGYGNKIWNPFYWDQLYRVFIESNTTKWESFIE